MVAAPPARTAALAAARARDSQDKRQRALAAVQALEAAGKPVTFPAVARAAHVSSWLVYAHGVREHVEAARHRQATTSAVVADTPRPAGPSPRRRAYEPTSHSPGRRSNGCGPSATRCYDACDSSSALRSTVRSVRS